MPSSRRRRCYTALSASCWPPRIGDASAASITSEPLEPLRDLTVRALEIVEHAWARHGGTYFDVKVEGGFDHETGALLVADVIDSDSGRLRFGDKDRSNQAYRDGGQSLPDIKRNVDDVADLTKQLV